MEKKITKIRKEMANYQQKLLNEGKIDEAIAVDKVALIINKMVKDED